MTTWSWRPRAGRRSHRPGTSTWSPTRKWRSRSWGTSSGPTRGRPPPPRSPACGRSWPRPGRPTTTIGRRPAARSRSWCSSASPESGGGGRVRGGRPPPPQPVDDIAHRGRGRPVRGHGQDPRLALRGLLGGQLAVQQLRREEVPVPPRQVRLERLPALPQVNQRALRPAGQQDVTVFAAERQTGDDGRLPRRDALVHPGPDGLQPRPAVGVGERLAAMHLGDRRRGVEGVGVGGGPAQPLGQLSPDRGLTAAGRPGDDDDHAAGLYRRGQRWPNPWPPQPPKPPKPWPPVWPTPNWWNHAAPPEPMRRRATARPYRSREKERDGAEYSSVAG